MCSHGWTHLFIFKLFTSPFIQPILVFPKTRDEEKLKDNWDFVWAVDDVDQ